MQWFRNLKIGSKLVLIMLLVSLIPLAIVGITTFSQSKGIIKDSIYDIQELYSAKKTTEINDWFSDLESNVQISAATYSTFQSMNILKELSGDLNSPQWKERVKLMESGFNIMIAEYSVPVLNVIDPTGRIVYSNESSIIGSSLAERDYFKKSISGTISYSDFFYSDVVNQNCMTINTPIFENGKDGNVVGVISIIADEKTINSITNAGIEEIGTTTNAYLVDENGVLLSIPRFGNKIAFKDRVDSTATRKLSSNIKAKSDFSGFGEYKDFRGKNVLGNYHVFAIGDKGIGMIFEIEAVEAFAGINNLRNFMLLICIIAIIAIFFAGILFSNTFKRPINKLVEVSTEIADGNLDIAINLNTEDEIGLLGKAFSKMAENVNDIMTNIKQTAEQVSTGASQISNVSQALSSGATEQASAIEEITASVQELAAQTSQNTDDANRANKLSIEVKNSAMKGNIKMKEMLKSMDEINTSSTSISKIIKVIDEIAFQTNILALNAAVEAARAGQYGKGFAVVAEEVRNLAERSAKAAKETTDMIEGSIAKVKDGTKIAIDTDKSLNDIIDGVANVVTLVDGIDRASNEQKIGIDQVSEAIEQVSKVVQTNSATSEESAASSEELSSQAEVLKELVNHFKLKDASSFKR